MRVNKIKKRDKNAKKEDDPRIFMWYIKNNGSKIITSYHIHLRF